MSQPLARLGLRAALRRPLPLASRVGVRAFSVTAARGYANPTPTDKYGVPDYSKGPSALDKASQLFFFTEIFRGALLQLRWRVGLDLEPGLGLSWWLKRWQGLHVLSGMEVEAPTWTSWRVTQRTTMLDVPVAFLSFLPCGGTHLQPPRHRIIEMPRRAAHWKPSPLRTPAPAPFQSSSPAPLCCDRDFR